MRVTAFVDGFNLYHAVDDTGLEHLKWLDLWALGRVFAPAPQYELTDVFYFSAYATWRASAYARRRAYVAALEAVGVTPVLGAFKAKTRRCHVCFAEWTAHEEKETDVNIALAMLDGAFRDRYDRALLFTGDSDLAPAVRLVLRDFPDKHVRIITPSRRAYPFDLVQAAGGIATAKRLKRIHLERCLLPEVVIDSSGAIVARRPAKYAPPSSRC